MTQTMIIALVALVMLSSFFSGVETAFVALSRLRLRHMIEKRKDENALLVKKLKDDSHRLISTLLIGNNLVNIAASAIATSIAIDIYGSKGVGIATFTMTMVVLVFGEITPKTIAIANAEKICLFTARPIYWLGIMLTPLIWVLDLFTRNITRFFHTKTGEQPIVTEEEIKSFVNIGEEIGSIEKDEKEMINNIFKLNDTEVKDIMTPKIHVMTYNENLTVRSIKKSIVNTRFSRIPVTDGNADNVTGVLYVKDVMKAIALNKQNISLKKIARPGFFVPETKRADHLLSEFQKKKVHIAIVVDEYGVFSGIVTIEDLLEEIVGEIYDETDIVKENIRKLRNRTFEIDGDTPLEDIRKKLNISIKTGKEISTISGLVMDKIGFIPRPGDTVELRAHRIEVLSMQGQRIAKVRLAKK